MAEPWMGQPRGRSPHECDFGSNFTEFNQLALWTAATLSGMVTAMLAARTPFFRRVIARLYPGAGQSGKSRKPSRRESLPLLADAVIGTPRETIMAVFGPPRAAIVVSDDPAAGVLAATTWYYPLPRNGKMAMAICFEDDTARQVDFVLAPRQ